MKKKKTISKEKRTNEVHLLYLISTTGWEIKDDGVNRFTELKCAQAGKKRESVYV
jgi:hypothetical protein